MYDEVDYSSLKFGNEYRIESENLTSEHAIEVPLSQIEDDDSSDIMVDRRKVQ